jgi:MYXO-CTERM domain-containing protein
MFLRRRLALPLGLFLAGIVASPRAQAFCRTTTQAPPADFDPSEGGCWNGGKPLFWRNACVGFSVQKADGKKIKAADLAQALNQAFGAWTSAACTAGGHPSVQVKQLDSTTVDTVEYKSGGPNVNVVVMRDDQWNHSGGETLALTTTSFDAETGEIFDADIEINTKDNDFALSDPVAADAMDLRTVLAHQAGHFLGFAHSTEAKSPMFNSIEPGEIDHRDLVPDDVTGVCDTYAPDGTRKTAGGPVSAASCDPTPRGGLETAPTPASTKGCATSATDRSASAVSGVALTALAALALSASRRRRRRR